jgi:hypothetical protein
MVKLSGLNRLEEEIAFIDKINHNMFLAYQNL